MQKKIVAAICAAALALALPLAAFAAGSSDGNMVEVSDSQATVSLKDDVKSGNVTLSNIKIYGAKGYVEHAGVTAAGTSASVPANAIAGSVAVFKVEGWKANWSEKVINSTNSFGTFYNKITADVKFAEAVTAELPSSVATTNLYVAGRYYSNIGGQVANVEAQNLMLNGTTQNAAATVSSVHSATGSIVVDGLGTGELVIWMQNGKYAAGDVNNTKDLEASAADASKSPKTGELR